MSPTRVRYLTAGLLTIIACLLYLDRYAIGIASERMRHDLRMTQTEISWFLSAFFWSYALSQLPAGWLSDRFGPRAMLTIYILGWSLFTGLLGTTTIVWLILLWRFLCGATQAGAYPVASGLIRSWFPLQQRGIASSIVAMGGRTGAVVAPIVTAELIAVFHDRWQPVLIVYGLLGFVTALLFLIVCRNSPCEHPLCNDAEKRFITPELTTSGDLEYHRPSFPWRMLLSSVSLWGNSVTQLLTNIGWLFVVTWLPRYLESMHNIPLKEQAVMTAIPTAVGILGMLCGGWGTDLAVRKLGLKWGRRIPVLVTRFLAAAGYGACIIVSQWTADKDAMWAAWAIIACLSFATFACDFGVPAIWAYAQDVGGPFTASIMAWSNMWGNLGAAVAPLLYNEVLGETPTVTEWNQLFALCAGVFILSGLSALVLDSTMPISTIAEKS